MRSFISAALFASTYAQIFDGDGHKTFQEICVENGFKYEEHTVVTEDGYILTVFRIPGMEGETISDSPKPVVFMQHGLMDAADAWVMNWADVAPAFVTSRAGYDVWLGNTRGNTYSRAHVSLDPERNKRQFWAYDFEQMG